MSLFESIFSSKIWKEFNVKDKSVKERAFLKSSCLTFLEIALQQGETACLAPSTETKQQKLRLESYISTEHTCGLYVSLPVSRYNLKLINAILQFSNLHDWIFIKYTI